MGRHADFVDIKSQAERMARIGGAQDPERRLRDFWPDVVSREDCEAHKNLRMQISIL